MGSFFKNPFDFDGDGELNPFELGTEFMVLNEMMKDDDDDWSDDDDDWDDLDDDDDDF